MKRLRAQHVNSPSMRAKCPKVDAKTRSSPVVCRQQSLSALWNLAPVRDPVVCLERQSNVTTATDGVLYAVDLFCGMGGWSCGAEKAGYTIKLAIDSWPEALRIHKANHPHAIHCRMVLGPHSEKALERLIARHIPAGASWHLHASPPCTSISKLHNVKNLHADSGSSFDCGMNPVMWSLTLVSKLKPTTWSFEQAPEREILGMLRWLKYNEPDHVQFACVDFAEYGLCQHRIRVLAGSPKLLNPFLTNPALRAKPPMLSEILETPPGAVWLRSSTGKTPKPHATVAHADGTFTNSTIRRDVKSIHAISWTAVAMHPHAYLTADFKQIRLLTPRERATIQSIPAAHILQPRKCSKVSTQRAVGNCVPPMIARLLMGGAHQ